MTEVDIKIEIDPDYPDKVEIHLLDATGAIIEGAQFDRFAFMSWVLRFYNENY